MNMMSTDTISTAPLPSLPFKVRLKRLLEETRGQDFIEYALLMSFMVLAIYVVLPSELLPSITSIFQQIIDLLGIAANGAGS
jgi:Flp pilus assembly pilin Flp